MALNSEEKYYHRLFGNIHLAALRLVLIYTVVAGIYIFTSDRIVNAVLHEPNRITWLQTAKGLAFVAITSIMLYGLISSYLVRLRNVHNDLAESENTFATAFRQNPEALSISTIDDGIYLDVNQGYTALTGYRHDEVVGRTIQDIHIWIFPQDRSKLIEQLASQGQVFNMETRFRTKDDVLKDVLVSASIINVQGKKCMIAMIKDITQIKASRLELDHYNRELSNKNKELESIIYVASHDLRSALVNIQGFSRELSMTCDRLRQALADPSIPDTLRGELHSIIDSEIPETLDFIISSTSKIDMLLTGLLKLSHLSRQVVDFTTLNMNQLIHDLVRNMDFQFIQAGAKITIEDLHPCIGDKALVTQAFQNLLTNALKYLDPSRPGRIRVVSEKIDSTVNYCVEDNGIGIEPQYQEKIFEIFHRLNPTQSPGDGLGLTIVRQVMERHNGKVWVTSTPGVGSRFCLSFATAAK